MEDRTLSSLESKDISKMRAIEYFYNLFNK